MGSTMTGCSSFGVVSSSISKSLSFSRSLSLKDRNLDLPRSEVDIELPLAMLLPLGLPLTPGSVTDLDLSLLACFCRNLGSFEA